MFGNWGGNKEKQNIITPETVKANASAYVKNLHKQADDLRQEIASLEDRLKNLKPEIDKAFKSREVAIVKKEEQVASKLAEVDEKESKLSVKETKLKESQRLVAADRIHLQKYIDEKEKANEKVANDLLVDKTSLESVRETLNKTIDIYRQRINEVDVLAGDVRDEKKVFQNEKDDWNAKEKDLTSRENKMAESEKVLDAKRFLSDKKEKDLIELREKIRLEKIECDEALEKLKEEQAKNRQILALNEVKEADALKASQIQVDERNQLNIFKKILEAKEAALQRRESNLKQLEALK